MSRRILHTGSWGPLLSCTECTVRGAPSCTCDAVTRADALIRRHGTGSVFEHVTHVFWAEVTRQRHTLVTLAVSQHHDSLARELVARGEPWLVDGQCPLTCPAFDTPPHGSYPRWRTTLDRWIALGFNVNWPLAGEWPILAEALWRDVDAPVISCLVHEYGCDAMTKSMVQMALVARVTPEIDRNIRRLLYTRPWPPELVDGCARTIVLRPKNLSDQTRAALMCYVWTLQARALVLAGRRRRRHWLPTELWTLIFREFVMPELL
jgi:hypothetical protein